MQDFILTVLLVFLVILMIKSLLQKPEKGYNPYIKKAQRNYAKAYSSKPHTKSESAASLENNKSFFTKIVGVSYLNEDGSSRQELIKSCSIGEKLVISKDINNKFSKNAIKISKVYNSQLGFLSEDLKIHQSINSGKIITAKIKNITGGKDGSLFGCNIEIVIENHSFTL